MDLDEIKEKATALSMWAHMATVGADGKPDVVPVHPCWGPAPGAPDDDRSVLWTMCGADSVKARNIAANNNVALHWQVTEVGDGVEVWGTAEVFTDLDTKRRLWTGVFDYDLNGFAPGGPENSEGTAFVATYPERALYLEMYGMKGAHRWTKDGSK
jgi:general stress protein 26